MNSTNMPSGLDARLERLLGGAELAPLRLRMRRYFERVDNGAAGDILQLTQLSAAEHEALALLTGRPSRPSRSARIDVRQLDAALLEAGIAGSLRAALELIDGPIVNRAAHRNSIQAQWDSVTSLGHWHVALRDWLQTPAAVRMLKRLTRQDPATAQQLLERADIVLRRLPTDDVPLSQLAAETLGNAHALDSGEPTATIILAAWRRLESRNTSCANSWDQDDEQDDVRLPEERVRDIWARAGVLINELARPVLFLNLPVAGHDTTMGTPGESAYLSLRRLLRTPPVWAVNGVTVFVCENPNLVAIAADRLGAASAPLVCTDGMPAAAQRTLLNQLERAGARLMYHGDFDWPGLQIANHVMRTWQVHPWRFSAQDYEAAATNAPHTRHDLSGACVAASWDVALMLAMQRHGIVIAEEAVAASLLEDLHQIA
ncbi:MAG: hypothetical protein QOD95_1983 [Gammaproteobacteria bacterium]|jgi:uncharacterized protein (TIGR02679 family)|nr:hypothetical protein [Gammaproteobacteria bacterium]